MTLLVLVLVLLFDYKPDTSLFLLVLFRTLGPH